MLIDDLLRAVDARRDDLVALTQGLVRIPSLNPPGAHYRACVELVGERLRRRGFEVAYLRADGAPGDSDRYPRWNAVCRFAAARGGPCVHFNSHVDVVAVGEGWTRDPFAGEIEGGRLYGRGSCDMKGGLAASVVAVEALLDCGLVPAGAVEVSATADEESGGYAGVAWLAERGYFSPPRVDHVIIPEPFNGDLVSIGHRGVWWAEVETYGHVAHGCMPFLGDCAVRHMAAVIERFERELYPALAERRTATPVIPDEARRATLNLTAIHGGLAEPRDGLPTPMVPDTCRLLLDRRFLAEESLDGVKAEVVRLLDALAAERPGFRYRVRDVMEVLPVQADADMPTPRALDAALRAVTGKPARFVASPGTYDQKHVERVGGVRDCVAYGPGILALAHQPDEYVAIDDLVESAKVMAAAAARLLGGWR